MPQKGILEVEFFYVWGLNFMGPFPSSLSHLYILLAVDYVSRWIEAVGTKAVKITILTRRIARFYVSTVGNELTVFKIVYLAKIA